MTILAAENHFRKGLSALVDNNPAIASECFQAAILSEVQRGVKKPQMRYLSYYGLSRAQAFGANPQSTQACERAARRDSFNPELHLNLGRVYLLAGKATKAITSFEQGLALAPDHKGLLSEFRKLNRRAAPPIGLVPRSHPLNKWLGKLRASMASRVAKHSGTTRANAPQF